MISSGLIYWWVAKHIASVFDSGSGASLVGVGPLVANKSTLSRLLLTDDVAFGASVRSGGIIFIDIREDLIGRHIDLSFNNSDF